MKFLKVLAAVVVVSVSFAAVPSFAQGPGGRGGDPVARMSQALNLTPAQQNKARAIFNEFRPKMEALRSSPNGREQMRPLFEQMRAKLEAILTPAQKKKMESMGGMMGGGPGGRMQGALSQLNLNAGQKKKIDAILSEMRAKIQAIPQDQRRQQMRPLMETYRGKIESVMNAQQKAKFEGLMQQGRGGGRMGAGGGA